MSLVHHVPDLAFVRCMGCDEPIERADLVEEKRHGLRSCCLHHVYHFWCIRRESDREPAAFETCAYCNEPFEPEIVRAALRWTLSFGARLHRRTRLWTEHGGVHVQEPDPAMPRPAAVTTVRVATARERTYPVRAFEPLFDGNERRLEEWSRARMELAHAHGCPRDGDGVRRLVLARADDALRRAYADELERSGDGERAAIVRLAIAHRELAQRNPPPPPVDDATIELWELPGLMTTPQSRELKERCRHLPRSWCRAVCATR